MAQQKGILKLRGNIGDITFYKTKDGFGSREKGGVDKHRVATDPSYQRTRENNQEFRRATSAGKLIRTAFAALLRRSADGTVTNRLTREMSRVIKADTRSERGERNVMAGVCGLLERFQFNSEAPLTSVFTAPFNVNGDRVSGSFDMEIPPFIPMDMVVAPPGSTHFRIISAAAEFDFDAGTYTMEQDVQPEIAVKMIAPTVGISISHQLTRATTLPVFVVLGIEFMQQVNGVSYPLTNGGFNSLMLVKVDQV